MTVASWITKQRRSLRSIGNALPLLDIGLFRRRNAITDHIKSLKRLRSRLDPISSARRDAVSGEPGIDAERRSRFEHEVGTAFQGELNRTKNEVMARLRDLNVSIKRLGPPPEINSKEIFLTLDEDTKAELSAWGEKLRLSQVNLLLAKRQLNKFRADNVLFRECRQDRIAPAILVAVALILLEAFINYYYLVTQAAVSQRSAIIAVISLATVNVLMSLCIGFWGLRRLNHVRWSQKSFGAIISVVVGTAVLILHLLLANYRYELGIALSDPLSSDAERLLGLLQQARVEAANNVFVNPFVDGLTSQLIFAANGDIDAISVFCYGMIFSIIAIAEGYFLFDDPYPGYGQVTRAHARADVRKNLVESGFKEQIRRHVDAIQNKLSELSRQSNQRLQTFKTYLDDASMLMRQYEEAASQIEHTLIRIVQDYRDEYISIREVREPEFWQDDFPVLDRSLPFEFDNLVQVEEREAAEDNQAQELIDGLRATVSAAQTDVMARVEAYLDEVDRDARAEDISLANLMGVREPAPT